MHDVTFRLDDEAVTTAVAGDDYLLDAAEAAGLDLPYSCRNGMCTSCAGRLLAGEVDDGEASSLSPRQTDEGYVLLCCSAPETDCEIRAGGRVRDEMLGLDAI